MSEAFDYLRDRCGRGHRSGLAEMLSGLRPGAAPLSLRIVLSLGAMIGLLAGAAEWLPRTAAPAMAIVFVAAALSSVAGFAFSAICGALLFYIIPPVLAVQLMMVCSIAIQGFSVLALRHSIDWRVLWRFVLGGVLSIPVGIYLLLDLDAALYCRVLGGFLVAYGLFMLLRPAARLDIRHGWADAVAGLLGGITGGFAGFPGAFVTIWCGLKGWDKNRQRGVYQPFILIMQVLGLAAISLAAAAGPHHGLHSIGWGALSYVPAALLGTWCGLGWYRRLSDAQFSRVVNFLLIASGTALVFA
jgi:uncharacterized protein